MLAAIRRYALAVALWLAGLWLQFRPMLSTALARVEGDWNDTRLVNYFLEHSWRWLLRLPTDRHLWELPAFFPVRNTAAYSDVLFSVAPFYWLFRALGCAPDTAMELWLLITASLNFVVAFAFLRRAIRVGPDGAALGAFLFAFGAPRTAQVMHAQLVPQFYTMIALYALWRIFGERAPREERPVLDPGFEERDSPSARASVRLPFSPWPTVFGVSLVAQAYACVYYAWFLGFALLIAVVWALVRRADRVALLSTVRANAMALGVGIAVSLLFVAPLALHYLAATRAVGYRSFSDVVLMLPRPASWLYYGEGHWLYGWFTRLRAFAIPMEHEHHLGFGFATLVIALFGLWRERGRPWVRLLFATSATIIVLVTLWAPGLTLWRVIFRVVPGARALRAVSRFGILLLVPASIGVALALDRGERALAERGGAQGPRVLLRYTFVLYLVAVVLLEQGARLPSYRRARGRERVATLVRAIPDRCTAFLYSPFAPNGDPNWYHGDAMWASLARDIPTLNGYSGNFPVGWPFLDVIARDSAQDAELRRRFTDWVRRSGLDSATTCLVRLDHPDPPSPE